MVGRLTALGPSSRLPTPRPQRERRGSRWSRRTPPRRPARRARSPAGAPARPRVSVPRPTSRRTSSSHDGGLRNTNSASGIVLADLPGALEVDLEQRGPALGQGLLDRAARGAVAVPCRARPPTPAARRRRPSGRTPRRRRSGSARRRPRPARRPGGRRHRDPDLRVVLADVRRDRALADRGRARRGRRAATRSRVGRRLDVPARRTRARAPRPGWCPGRGPGGSRRSPSRSIICLARTLPRPGIDCSRSTTRILPMTSLFWPSCSTSTIEAPSA